MEPRINIMDPSLEFLREDAERVAIMLGMDVLELACAPECFAQMNLPTVVFLSIAQCTRSGFDPRYVMAHEARHLFQYREGWITADESIPMLGLYACMWKGESGTWCVHNSEQYRALPWEADANEFADQYMDSLRATKAA